jgi:ABC-type multidrug transport system fused ATPase/permease subunit
MKNNPVVYLTRKLWQFSGSNKPKVALFFVMFVIAHSVSFFEPLIVGWLLNAVQEQGISAENLYYLIGIASLLVVVRIIFWLFHGPARVMQRENSFLVRANYKDYLLNGVLKMPPNWHANHPSGDTIDRIEKGTVALHNYAGLVHEVVDTVIRFTSSYLALAYFNLHSSYLVGFFVVITIWVILKFDKKIIPQYEELNQKENAITAKVFDVISNITTVIILRVESLMRKAIWKKMVAPLKLFRNNITINEIKWFVVSIMTVFMIVAVLGSYFAQVISSAIAIGTVYILYEYVQRINNLFYRFAFRYGEFAKYYADVQNSEQIAEQFARRRPVRRLAGKYHWRQIQVKNVDFSYETEEGRLQLKNVNMAIRRGERIALVGESGSGKTTMVKLIRGLYPVQKGEVIVDGMKLKDKFRAMESHMALIPQDPEIFNATVRENITFGLNIRKSTVRKFTDMARVTGVINRLPHKENSYIFEKGVNLSGGEKQRLALARGLLAARARSMILLDEPTSSVDPKNEQLIFRNIFREFSDKTIISSVHRMHLLSMFDKIYFFDNGRIVAEGTFDEVMKTSRLFREQWRKYKKSQKKT